MKFLLIGICFCNIHLIAQTNTNTPNRIPVNADPSSTPPPVQSSPTTPQRGTEPNNKVMLRAVTDSMDSKKRTAPSQSQKIYQDTTRYLIHPGDTDTAPKR